MGRLQRIDAWRSHRESRATWSDWTCSTSTESVDLIPLSLNNFHQRLHLGFKSVGVNAELFHNGQWHISGLNGGNLLVELLEDCIVVFNHRGNILQLGTDQIELLV